MRLFGGGGAESDTIAIGTTAQQWECTHCLNANTSSLFGHLCCDACHRISPGVSQLAQLGLQLAWVPADSDCFYHVLVQHELLSLGYDLRPNDPLYENRLLQLRRQSAQALTATEMRTGSSPEAVVVRSWIAEANRADANRQVRGPLDSRPAAIRSAWWDAFARDVGKRKGRWADAQIEGPIMAAKLQRSVAVITWDMVVAGGNRALQAIVYRFTDAADGGAVSTERVAPLDMAHPALASNTDDPTKAPILVFYNGINHFWRIKLSDPANAGNAASMALWAPFDKRLEFRAAQRGSGNGAAAMRCIFCSWTGFLHS